MTSEFYIFETHCFTDFAVTPIIDTVAPFYYSSHYNILQVCVVKEFI